MSSVATNQKVEFGRVPLGRIAMWWVIASEVVIFGGLITCYLLYRIRYPEWGHEAAHTNTWLGALNTFVLLTSSFTIVLAHAASTKGELKKVWLYSLCTILGGFIFLGVKAVEYTTEIHHGFTITKSVFWSFYYVMTGLHASHVIAGMTAIFVVALKARKGEHLHRVEMAGLYWHFVDVVWIFLFPLLYIAK
ncbi:MAG TPA: cytochrome c oxidase subunit 3 [Leptospiraceae bacterium]|nr:cytochrome c oxidase subunit 3 [Leptospirales bacterium]HMU84076.1 cytochrome c oxidase subunit 3 [Leptospiraceae bacterium]HMW58250.1 cytochrome c oxidase subunit 3 [Leptospiraceae bacterium]HMX55784.1 cytochrome c oxidase subunit 3 [Leptospiraceae bacterium]HMY45713.1 cytochrome c oxidase subunit 3 [Leptospiraceae bacterium]